MATYNHARHLGKAIDSILEQTIGDLEFIIVDDGSTDETPKILDQCRDPRIIRLVNSTNLGLAASLNRGLEIAKGEYIARMDSDDVSLPGRLENQMRYLDNHHEVGIVGTQYKQIGREGAQGNESHMPLTHGLILWEYLTRLAYPLTHATIMMRSDVIKQYGGYNEEFQREQDGELFLRICRRTRLANLAEPLYVVRAGRAKSESGNVFARGYPVTIDLRRAFIGDLLGREIPDQVVRALIFPTSRRHRERLGLAPSLGCLHEAIALLLEIFDAMDEAGLFSEPEKEKASEEIPALLTNAASFSPEFALRVHERLPVREVAGHLGKRLGRHLNRVFRNGRKEAW
jgi:glycosyltransferase involved in cell wall biosynthesis